MDYPQVGADIESAAIGNGDVAFVGEPRIAVPFDEAADAFEDLLRFIVAAACSRSSS